MMSWFLHPSEAWRESFQGRLPLTKTPSAAAPEPSEIAAFYEGRSVFITGATGFLGKVLVEKLLRSCSGLNNIYILVRPKKGLDPNLRVKEMFNTPLFEQINREHPEAIHKVIAIKGDVTFPELGISNNDWSTLINEVSVVFHSAATVKFDEPLKVAVDFNVLGTRRLLELSRQMTHLAAIVHVSTAYSNSDRIEVDEVLYSPPVAPQKLIDAMQWMSDKLVSTMTPTLLGDRPNTYTFTKAVAEALVKEEGEDLPIAIVRPSIVTASWREPFRGWIDNLNGPSGLFTIWSLGLLRSLFIKGNAVADSIPVDTVINLMLAVSWATATKYPKSLKIYNCTSGASNPLKYGDSLNYASAGIKLYPSIHALRYPAATISTGIEMVNKINVFFLHLIPAYILDTISLALGTKQRLIKTYERLNRTQEVTKFFLSRDWTFKDGNVRELGESLLETDKKLFNFDIRDLHWPEYCLEYVLGLRKYVLNDSLLSLPEARKKLNMIYYRDNCVALFSVTLIFSAVYLLFTF